MSGAVKKWGRTDSMSADPVAPEQELRCDPHANGRFGQCARRFSTRPGVSIITTDRSTMNTTITSRPLTVSLSNDEANAAVYALAFETTSEAETLGSLAVTTLPCNLWEIARGCRRIAGLAHVGDQLLWRAHWGPHGGDAPALTAEQSVLLDLVSVLEQLAADREADPREDAHDGGFAFVEAARTIAAAYASGEPVSPNGDTDPMSPTGATPGVTIPAAPLARLRERTAGLVESAARALSEAQGHEDQTADMMQAIAYRRHLAGAGPYSPRVVAYVAADCVTWDAASDVEWPTRVDDEAAVALANHLAVIALRDECEALSNAGQGA